MQPLKLVTGLVETRAEADAAVRRIVDYGYPREAVSLVMSDSAHRDYVGIESGTQAAAGAGVGGAVGSAFGAVAAAILALGTTVILPGIGLVVAGPIAAALAGAGAGGVTGGLVGALVGLGISEERAHVYNVGLHDGRILIGVQARNDEDAVILEEILAGCGAARVRVTDVDGERLPRSA